MKTAHPGALTSLGFALLTVSDSRAFRDDVSGRRLRELAEAAGHRVVATELVRDERDEIDAAVRRLLALDTTDLVVVTGGTGFAPRDVTLEALQPLLERRLDGFGELFRFLSYAQVGAAAMLSQAAAGLVGQRALFILPGSPKAVELAMEKLILPAVGHLLALVRQA
jgi:molybdenum cofactor biosynthesis protein B